MLVVCCFFVCCLCVCCLIVVCCRGCLSSLCVVSCRLSRFVLRLSVSVVCISCLLAFLYYDVMLVVVVVC